MWEIKPTNIIPLYNLYIYILYIHIIKKIEAKDHVSDDSYLVLLDVRSLYTNIPHKEGIEVVKQKLKKSKPSISIKVILTF